MLSRELLIVGRGIVGLAVGFAAQRRGFKIRVIGPKNRLGSATLCAEGTSTLKGNIVAENPLFRAKIAGHYGLPTWLRDVEQASGVAIRKSFSGSYEPFTGVATYQKILDRVLHRRYKGLNQAATLRRDQLPQEAQWASSVVGSFHYLDDGWFSPNDVIDALETALLKGGAEFLDGLVQKVEARHQSVQIVVEGRDPVAAERVVLAAGYRTNDILEASGVSKLEQEGVDGETWCFSAPQELQDTPLLIKNGTVNLMIYGQDLRIGSTARRGTPFALDPNLPASFSSTMSLFPALSSLTDSSVLWGIRGRFRDRKPALGLLPGFFGRVFLATGFYKNGLQLGHLFAQNLVNEIESIPSYESDPEFSLRRFFS